MRELKISEAFSDTPGGRLREEGEYSGEEFRDVVLAPIYKECLDTGEILCINFDDCFGFGTSFLEEAFGGLVREYKYKDVLSHLKLIANDDETIYENVLKYIKAAEEKL